mgnify:CR=1 FL=1
MPTIGKQQLLDSGAADRITRFLLVVYLLVMTWILLFKLGVQFSYMAERRINLLPFREVIAGYARLDRMETLLNVFIFVPMGLYVGILFRNWPMRAKLAVFLLISAAFEILQYVFRIGAFDATDLVTNSLGGLLGLLIYFTIEKIMGSPGRAQRLVNSLAALGTLAVIAFLVSVKLGIGPIRYQ